MMSKIFPDESTSLGDKCFKDLVKSKSVRNGYYTSDEHDLIHEFYEPILKNAKTYDRTTGAFTSNWLFILGQSLIPFIRNAIKKKTKIPTQINISAKFILQNIRSK